MLPSQILQFTSFLCSHKIQSFYSRDLARVGILFRNHDRASAASSLGASELGPGQPQRVAQETQQRLVGAGLDGQFVFDARSIDKENGDRAVA